MCGNAALGKLAREHEVTGEVKAIASRRISFQTVAAKLDDGVDENRTLAKPVHYCLVKTVQIPIYPQKTFHIEAESGSST